MEYCGDGECNCGETCTSCQTDCGVCDTAPPTTNISVKRKSTGEIVAGGWLKADTYTIQFTDSDNIGLKNCKYEVYKKDAYGNYSISIVSSGTIRNCSPWSFDIPAGASPYETEGLARYRIFSEVEDNAGLKSNQTIFLHFDFTPPTTEIK